MMGSPGKTPALGAQSKDVSALFRAIPSVDACMAALEGAVDAPRALVRDEVNAFLDGCRRRIRSGELNDPAMLAGDGFWHALGRAVQKGTHARFRHVLNATGVVVHTNLGRSVMAPEALQAIVGACRGYSNLEFNLRTGKRGSRYDHVEELLCRLTGAEAALVVNNNAAAVFLTLGALCAGREAVVARGQLVEIGGSFRIPDIMMRSGVTLREVGCTNRVHPDDYEAAITDETAALMRVHTSNYRIVGFHADVPPAKLAEIAHAHGLLMIEDLGSGSLVDLTSSGLPYEPTVQSVVAAGADVVTFSGDKVLGGPQAGIIVGCRDIISRIKADPLNRALRVGKMTLAGLEATLRLYLDEKKARASVPTLHMILVSYDELKRKAQRLARMLKRRLGGQMTVAVVPSASKIGGGAFPEHDLPGYVVRVESAAVSAEMWRDRLLALDPPLVGRIVDDAFCLDPRTLAEDELAMTVKVMAEAGENHS